MNSMLIDCQIHPSYLDHSLKPLDWELPIETFYLFMLPLPYIQKQIPNYPKIRSTSKLCISITGLIFCHSFKNRDSGVLLTLLFLISYIEHSIWMSCLFCLLHTILTTTLHKRFITSHMSLNTGFSRGSSHLFHIIVILHINAGLIYLKYVSWDLCCSQSLV